MKKGSKGFTLIELLIVTVVIVMLMGIVFRLAGTGGESAARAKTIARLQRLSNAISGYYAAFGSYPPVPLQGRSRSIYTRVNSFGIQSEDGVDGSKNLADNTEMPKQIEAACRSQPVALACPFNPHPQSPVNDVLAAMHELGQIPKQYMLIESYGSFYRGNKGEPDAWKWSRNEVLQFGLMSFLLPRYEIMMDGVKDIYDTVSNPNGPWASNNRLPFLMDGSRPNSWFDIQNALGLGPHNFVGDGASVRDYKLAAMIRNLPSQAACARWMPNLEGIVTLGEARLGNGKFFGVDVVDHDERYLNSGHSKWLIIDSMGSESDEAVYIQNVYTVRDGWDHDFYYYSPPPYQSYTLWSAGPNGRTFPPWMEKPQGHEDRINNWIKDDLKAGDK